MLYRPEITDDIVNQINEMINNNPSWNRTKISEELCDLWDWKFPDGRKKSISCRDLLRALDSSGRIKLPAKIRNSRIAGRKIPVQTMLHDTTSVSGALSDLMPIKIVSSVEGELLKEYKSYIEQYHYLGYDRTVGENMKYMVYGNNGILLSCLLFGSAAWSCRGRDIHIGWEKEARKKNLQSMTNNTRFLILPWVNVPHLASHILAKIVRRVSSDWEKKYGHPVCCLETFVECDRFKGTCYKAANWIYAGKTTGRGRDDINKEFNLPVKDIYLYPLHKRYNKILQKESDEK